MDAHVTITGEWVNSLPPVTRKYVIQRVFKLAAEHGWEIRVGGQDWRF